MIFGSICSGIGAPEFAWSNIPGWECAFMSEIEPFPRAVLQHHFPNVPLAGDFTKIQKGDFKDIDLLVGGTPCTDFSIAGQRAGLSGNNGNLAIEFVRLLDRLKPRWFLWENVPGVLSADKRKAFGVFLGALADCGYHAAWSVLDSQWFGVAQRRKRLFVVGYLGDWRPPAQVLFESESMCGDPPTREKSWKTVGTLLGSGAGTERPAGVASELDFLVYDSRNGSEPIDVSPTLDTRCKDGPMRNQGGAIVVHA